MVDGKRLCDTQIKVLRMMKIICIPLGAVMFYFVGRAWGEAAGLAAAIIFGAVYYKIISSAIVDVIAGELKQGVEELISKVTKSPVHIEYEKIWGRMGFFIFLQEDNENITKLIYRRVVDKLKNSEYFNKIDILSMANVPDLKKETIDQFRAVMLENAVEISRKQGKEK